MLVDMKMTPAEKKQEMPQPCGPEMGPDYPYGLRPCLDAVAIEKLGLTMPEIGTEMQIQAIGKVVSCSMSDREYGDRDQRVEIQIMQLGVTPEESKAEDAKEPKTKQKVQYGRASTLLDDYA